MTKELKVELDVCFSAGEILLRYDLSEKHYVDVMTPTDLHELRSCFRFLDRHVGKTYNEDIDFIPLQDLWMTVRDVLQTVMTEIGNNDNSSAVGDDEDDLA
ncbi:MAG: hypothetical protein IPF59_08660 [Ignavibacteria bacterium]|nr:hypothetical protein [Ignavibacteria bacterium]MBK6420399.1 hypothetical protein [Ignavibacteria bacterium]